MPVLHSGKVGGRSARLALAAAGACRALIGLERSRKHTRGVCRVSQHKQMVERRPSMRVKGLRVHVPAVPAAVVAELGIRNGEVSHGTSSEQATARV